MRLTVIAALPILQAMQSIQAKASEIATALIKVSVYVRRMELRHRLEQVAFRLVEDISRSNWEETEKTLDAIEGLLTIGRHIYEIEPMNAHIIVREVSSLRDILARTGNQTSRGMSEKEIESIFSKNNADIASKDTKLMNIGKKENQATEYEIDEKANIILDEVANAAIEEEKIIRQNNMAIRQNHAEDNQAIRQSEIFEKMRQFGEQKVKLKDIAAAFPNFSERTIRYDLQRLCSQGLLERVGQGGPGTYYRIRVV